VTGLTAIGELKETEQSLGCVAATEGLLYCLAATAQSTRLNPYQKSVGSEPVSCRQQALSLKMKITVRIGKACVA
jgi:hypothetical protein